MSELNVYNREMFPKGSNKFFIVSTFFDFLSAFLSRFFVVFLSGLFVVLSGSGDVAPAPQGVRQHEQYEGEAL